MKYLDKAFFKFTIGFICIVAISLFIMYFASNFVVSEETQTAQPTSGR